MFDKHYKGYSRAGDLVPVVAIATAVLPTSHIMRYQPTWSHGWINGDLWLWRLERQWHEVIEIILPETQKRRFPFLPSTWVGFEIMEEGDDPITYGTHADTLVPILGPRFHHLNLRFTEVVSTEVTALAHGDKVRLRQHGGVMAFDYEEQTWAEDASLDPSRFDEWHPHWVRQEWYTVSAVGEKAPRPPEGCVAFTTEVQDAPQGEKYSHKFETQAYALPAGKGQRIETQRPRR